MLVTLLIAALAALTLANYDVMPMESVRGPAIIVQTVTSFYTHVGVETRFIPCSTPVTLSREITYYSTWLSVTSWATTSLAAATKMETVFAVAESTEHCATDTSCVDMAATKPYASTQSVTSVTIGTNTPYKPGFHPNWTTAQGPFVPTGGLSQASVGRPGSAALTGTVSATGLSGSASHS